MNIAPHYHAPIRYIPAQLREKLLQNADLRHRAEEAMVDAAQVQFTTEFKIVGATVCPLGVDVHGFHG